MAYVKAPSPVAIPRPVATEAELQRFLDTKDMSLLDKPMVFAMHDDYPGAMCEEVKAAPRGDMAAHIAPPSLARVRFHWQQIKPYYFLHRTGCPQYFCCGCCCLAPCMFPLAFFSPEEITRYTYLEVRFQALSHINTVKLAIPKRASGVPVSSAIHL